MTNMLAPAPAIYSNPIDWLLILAIPGVDGTKAFVSGDFTDAGLTDDISGLDANGIKDIEDWRLMYHKDYIYVGKINL